MAAVMNDELRMIEIDLLERGRFQPRRVFSEAGLQKLISSVRAQGMIEPLVVRPYMGRYELIAGERRWRAAQRVGMRQVPCLVRQIPEMEAARQALADTVREPLRPIEEAVAIKRLIDDYGVTHQQLANDLGCTREKISQSIRLLQLHPNIQRELDGYDDDESRVIKRSHAETLAGLTHAQQLECMRFIIDYHWTVEQLDNHCRQFRKARKKEKPRTPSDPDIRNQVEEISANLGAKVNITFVPKEERGKLEISFNSLEEFDGIKEILLRRRSE